MTSSALGKSLVAAALLGGMCGQASAGVITNIATVVLPGASTGSFGPVGVTPSPNNDNVAAASPNTLPYSVFFNAGGVGNLDIEFVVTNSGGTTEYRVTTAFPGLVNNTGQVWRDFHFQLGFGVGAGFVPSTGADALDFDMPNADPTPTSTVFTVLSHQADSIDWTGGAVPSIGGVGFTFAIDVPDDLQLVNPNGLNRFTLRQMPTLGSAAISEPATATLLLAGLVGVVGAARRGTARGSKRRRSEARPE